jgi:hypothetical protein
MVSALSSVDIEGIMKRMCTHKLNIRIDIVVVNFIDNCRNPNITGKHRTTPGHGMGGRTLVTAASSWPPSTCIWSRYISLDPILQSLWFQVMNEKIT